MCAINLLNLLNLEIMKFKNLVLIVLFILPALCFAQLNQQAMVDSLDGKWERNKNGQLTFSKTFEYSDIGMTTRFFRALNYFKGHFRNTYPNTSIKREDALKGNIKVTGLFPHMYNVLKVWDLTYSSNIKANVKIEAETATITIALKSYNLYYAYANGETKFTVLPIEYSYPVKLNSYNKYPEIKTFFNSYLEAQKVFEELELALNTPVNQAMN